MASPCSAPRLGRPRPQRLERLSLMEFVYIVWVKKQDHSLEELNSDIRPCFASGVLSLEQATLKKNACMFYYKKKKKKKKVISELKP
jgi:hypothetical protein